MVDGAFGKMLVASAGIAVADMIAADLQGIPDPGGLDYVDRGIGLHLGGHAVNVSIDLTKLGLPPKEVGVIASIGSDVFGEFIEKELHRFGVVTHLARTGKAGTSKSIILVEKGKDKRIFHEVGANWYLSPERVVKLVREERPEVFYVGASGFLGSFDEQLPRVLRAAKQEGAVTFIDPIIPYRRPPGLVLPALRWTDFFHCNESEAVKMTGEEDVSKAAASLAERGARTVLVTLGEEGGLAVTNGFALRFPSFGVNVVDPTGAGDAFCASVIFEILRRRKGARKRWVDSLTTREELAAIVMYGAAAGAACCMMEGTTTSVTRANVDKFVRRRGKGFKDVLRWKKL